MAFDLHNLYVLFVRYFFIIFSRIEGITLGPKLSCFKHYSFLTVLYQIRQLEAVFIDPIKHHCKWRDKGLYGSYIRDLGDYKLHCDSVLWKLYITVCQKTLNL